MAPEDLPNIFNNVVNIILIKYYARRREERGDNKLLSYFFYRGEINCSFSNVRPDEDIYYP